MSAGCYRWLARAEKVADVPEYNGQVAVSKD